MNQMLPGFEPSEEDMIKMALAMPLERKIEKSILFYQTYCDGAYGAFSGGKDSVVIKALAAEAKVGVDWHYNNVCIDPPELVRFIKEYHPEVKWNNPRQHLLTRMIEIEKRLPSRTQRWCCQTYKEQGGKGRDCVIGVRIAESARRAKLWRQVVPNKKSGANMLCPIVYWTDEDVWEYIHSRQLPYCSLYDEGFKRLGCVGCPLASVKQRREHFERWPNYERAWKRATKKMFEKWKGKLTKQGKPRYQLFDTWEELWDWWISEEMPDREQCVFDDMMSNT